MVNNVSVGTLTLRVCLVWGEGREGEGIWVILLPSPCLAGIILLEGRDFFLKFPLPFPQNPTLQKWGDLCGACSYFHCVDYFAPNIFKYLHFTQSITKTLGSHFFLADLLLQASSPSINFFFIPILIFSRRSSFKFHLHQSISSSSPSIFVHLH